MKKINLNYKCVSKIVLSGVISVFCVIGIMGSLINNDLLNIAGKSGYELYILKYIEKRDIQEKIDGYQITGNDPFIVYEVPDKVYSKNIYLIMNFTDFLRSGSQLQIFYSDTNHFSEDQSIWITQTDQQTNYAEISTNGKPIKYIRIDFDKDLGNVPAIRRVAIQEVSFVSNILNGISEFGFLKITMLWIVLFLLFVYMTMIRRKSAQKTIEGDTILKIYARSIYCYVKANRLLTIGIIGFAILAYGYEITNWSLTIDEEFSIHANRIQMFKGWIGDGRWGIALIKLVFPTYHVLPHFNGVLAIMILSLSTIVLAHFFYTLCNSQMASNVAALVFFTFPIHSFYLMFDTFSFEISIGLLFTIISAIQIYQYDIEKDRRKLILGIGLLTYALGIYQSNFQLFLGMLAIILVFETIKSDEITYKDQFKKLLVFALSLIVSGIIYFAINVTFQDCFGKSEYVEGYFRWAYMDWKTCVKQALFNVQNVILHPQKVFDGGGVLVICYIVIFAYMLYQNIKNKGKSIFISIIAIAMLFLSICSGYILMGGDMPLRTMSSIAIIPAIAFALMAYYIEKKKLSYAIKVLFIFLAFSQCVKASSIITEMFFSENTRIRYDEALLNRIVSKIEDLNLGEYPKEPVVFIGSHKWESQYAIYTGQFDTSIFDTKQNGRIYQWLYDIGYDFTAPTNDDEKIAERNAVNMPEWPFEGSVQCKDGVIIVNFGE
jgi:hypothetical protein